MKKIILKTEYPWCSSDDYIEVNDEIADVFTQYKRSEKAYKEKIRYHKAYYSLDEDNGTSKSILFVSASPDELFEKKLSNKELYKAISLLPEIQAKRIYARFFQELEIAEIASIEGVSYEAVRKSIEKSLKNLEKLLKRGL